MSASDDEALVERCSAEFDRANARAGHGAASRAVVKQLLRCGARCASAREFVEQARRFSHGFAQGGEAADAALGTLFRDIRARVGEVASLAGGQPASVVSSSSSLSSSAAGSRGTGSGGGGAGQDSEFDRQFYGVEEGEAAAFLGSEQRWQERQAAVAVRQQQQQQQQQGTASQRARQAASQREQSAWEDSLLSRSGAGPSGGGALSLGGDESAEKVHIVVHGDKPPFLVGDVQWDAAPANAQVVREEKCDMAQAALRGSTVVAKLRESNARTKMQHKFWELGGSRIGAAMGVGGGEAEYGQSAEAAAEASLRALEAEASAAIGISGSISARAEIRRVRESLPVYGVRGDLLRCVRGNQVTVVVGETGSGKTTQLTQYLREDGMCRGAGGARLMIGCTQPRRVAAMSVAKRVADEVGCEVGLAVGYAIRFEDCTCEATEIKYMTDGVLMRETLSSRDLDGYACVVMDEAHERSLFTDVLFGILRGVVKRRLDFRLVVTSATMDADKFADFFGGAATFYIPGRTFKVDTFFAKSVVADYVEAAVRQALEIHLAHPEGDILIFMTGQEDVAATCQLLAERAEALAGDNKAGIPELLLLPMYSQLPADLQSRIFERARKGQRKCVVSTNLAETSLTVDGIKYVIDCGFCKLKVFNPRVGIDALRITPVSQANANQRAGRAGRTSEGFCWRLYTSGQFARELLPAQVPEIQRTNLANVVLLLKSLGVSDLLSFDFMDPPPRDNIVASMYHLWVLGALDNQGALTALGKNMARYPLDPPLAKLLLTAQELRCANDALTVVSMLSVPEVFYRPQERAEESDLARERFQVPESDHLTLVNVYNLVQRNGFSPAFCAKHFIHLKSVRKASEVRQQLQSMIKDAEMDAAAHGATPGAAAPRVGGTSVGSWDLVRKAICSAYFVNAARLKNVTQYTNLLNGAPTTLHPSSALCGSGETPEYVVYHEMVLTNKEYMRTVTAIDPLWLAQMGPMFFSLKGHRSQAQHRVALAAEQHQHHGDSDQDEQGPAIAPSRAPKPPSGIAGLDLAAKKKKRKLGL